MFSIQARGPKGRRVFLIKPDTLPEVQEWIDSIRKNIDGGAAPGGGAGGAGTGGGGGAGVGGGGANNAGVVVNNQAGGTTPSGPTNSQNGSTPPVMPAKVEYPPSSARGKLASAKTSIPFLQESDSKVLEFWQIWSESIPPKSELVAGQAIDFHVAASAELEKLTWRTSGPQNLFIQKMVDFFWNVGAPESEIDRLNDVGALINPVRIGSWIDMSGKGGMDGGWYFPVDISMKLALEAADAGEPTKKVLEWSEAHSVASCFSVGRDMGAAPPRQTELRMKLPGPDFSHQLSVAVNAFLAFGFPALPENALGAIRASPPTEPLCLSIITSSEGFVRLGVLFPHPGKELARVLVEQVNGRPDALSRLEAALGGTPPAFVEMQYLMKGFGYGVYKEGFDIVVHWTVTPEETMGS
eukprot:TRINITY_DN725_c0_g2_i1.p1 TRINITY_DN725_c0_g2~~TRINITY_DN725_c0_g2_i1.p1  ORF type:complete len:411 (+),score=127.50 TRINITY_DN725_c0_g2_i1:170-1402(+)